MGKVHENPILKILAIVIDLFSVMKTPFPGLIPEAIFKNRKPSSSSGQNSHGSLRFRFPNWLYSLPLLSFRFANKPMFSHPDLTNYKTKKPSCKENRPKTAFNHPIEPLPFQFYQPIQLHRIFHRQFSLQRVRWSPWQSFPKPGFLWAPGSSNRIIDRRWLWKRRLHVR